MDRSLLPALPGRLDRCRVAVGRHPGLIEMSGEFDDTGHQAVRDALDAVADGAAGEIRVDLRAVKLIDSGTVRLLLHASRAADDAGRRLRITGATGSVRRVIQASGAAKQLFDLPDGAGPAIRTADVARLVHEPTYADQVRAQLRRAESEQARIHGKLQQDIIDGEVRFTRRVVLARLRERLRTDRGALASDEFLAGADTPTVLDAIVLAATIVGAADACDLQLYDPVVGALLITRQRGFSKEFLTYFATVDPSEPTACAMAMRTGEPVIVDDVTRSPIFAGQPTLPVMLAAGSLAVHTHPLKDEAGQLMGVLSFHYRERRPRRGDPEMVAWCAARALAHTRRP